MLRDVISKSNAALAHMMPQEESWWEYRQRPPRLIVADKGKIVIHAESTLFCGTTKQNRSTNFKGEPIHDNVTLFDTDSATVGIDNRCSACISHQLSDFDGPVAKVDRTIKGFGGARTYNVYRGTIVWKWHGLVTSVMVI